MGYVQARTGTTVEFVPQSHHLQPSQILSKKLSSHIIPAILHANTGIFSGVNLATFPHSDSHIGSSAAKWPLNGFAVDVADS
jgi:hypothetical protein